MKTIEITIWSIAIFFDIVTTILGVADEAITQKMMTFSTANTARHLEISFWIGVLFSVTSTSGAVALTSYDKISKKIAEIKNK